MMATQPCTHLAAQVAPQRQLNQQQPIIDLENQEENTLWCGIGISPVICQIAAKVISAPPFHTLLGAVLGFGLGFLAKKVAIHYNILDPAGEDLLKQLRRFTVLQVLVVAVSTAVSFVFPVIALCCATGAGIIGGLATTVYIRK